MKRTFPRSLSCPRGLLIAAVMAAGSTAVAQSDLTTTIISENPEYYWLMEDSFTSRVPSPDVTATPSVTFSALERSTPDHPIPMLQPDKSDYFPLLMDHMTVVPSSSALIFGEAFHDLSGAERFLELGSKHFGLVNPMDGLGMSARDPWAMHLLVSPDEDAISGNWEVLFQVGDPVDDGITLEIDRIGSNTTFRLTRAAEGVQTQSTVTVNGASAYTANGRKWYQVIARYYNIGSYKHTLRVNGVSDTDTSIGVIQFNVPGNAMVGADQNDNNVFRGAMHHLAFWNTGLTKGIVTSLEAARSVAPPARQDLSIDWNADPIYHVWIVPESTQDLVTNPPPPATGPERNLLKWKDPIWDRDRVWPMVRFYSDRPHTWNATPPGYARVPVPPTGPDNRPVDMAQSAFNWVEYINTNLTTYCRDIVPTKDLTGGYTMLLQDWGKSSGGYSDFEGRRGLIQDWRDCPQSWRDDPSDTSVGLLGTGGTRNHDYELMIPFFREGMSVNAFRTRAMFAELADLLSAGELPVPTRLHMDTEAWSPAYTALPGQPTVGWWDTAYAGSRADEVAYWISETNELADLPASGTGVGDFNKNHYGFAFGPALVTPAIEELSADTRISEYKVFNTGDGTDPSQLPYWFRPGYVRANASVHLLDFSAPVLYPLHNNRLEGSGQSALEGWATELDFSTLGIVLLYEDAAKDLDDLHEDLQNIYVEVAKHNIQASYLASVATDGKPMAPWLPIPGGAWVNMNDKFDPLPISYYGARWQEVARIAVFAYRRGVREFIFWGHDPAPSNYVHSTEQVLGLVEIFNAIEHAEASMWDFTSDNARYRSHDGFGVPDGNLNNWDCLYFEDRWNAGDPEADITGPNGHPDGIVDYDNDYLYFFGNSHCYQ